MNLRNSQKNRVVGILLGIPVGFVIAADNAILLPITIGGSVLFFSLIFGLAKGIEKGLEKRIYIKLTAKKQGPNV